MRALSTAIRGKSHNPRASPHRVCVFPCFRPQFLDAEWGAQLAKRTVGLRIPIAHFVCKIKLSHDKSRANQLRVIAALRAPGPYHHPALADDMERSLAS